jgi:hypothetical protein
MRVAAQRLGHAASALAALGGGLALWGCGSAGQMSQPPPISVSLSVSNVVVTRGGTPTIVLIDISSTSETALVSVAGMPGGVGEKYAASDTNPSGTLTFTAGSTAALGTYTPIVMVLSAGQMAETKFTLVVNAAKTAADGRL